MTIAHITRWHWANAKTRALYDIWLIIILIPEANILLIRLIGEPDTQWSFIERHTMHICTRNTRCTISTHCTCNTLHTTVLICSFLAQGELCSDYYIWHIVSISFCGAVVSILDLQAERRRFNSCQRQTFYWSASLVSPTLNDVSLRDTHCTHCTRNARCTFSTLCTRNARCTLSTLAHACLDSLLPRSGGVM